MNNHLSTWCIPLNSMTYLFTQDQNENRVWIAWVDFLQTKCHSFQSSSSEGVNMSILIFFLSIAILSMWLDSIQWMWVNFKCIKSLPTIYPIYLIHHFNVTIIVWLVPQLNASTSFFTLTRFLGRQAIACPSPLLSTSKPFLAIFTISSHQVTLGVKSFIKVICIIVFQCSKL
jgi:hypothetical protein